MRIGKERASLGFHSLKLTKEVKFVLRRINVGGGY